MKYILALVLLSSCVNLQPVSKCKTTHYIHKHKGVKIYTTKQTYYTIINDTIKQIEYEATNIDSGINECTLF